MIDIKSDFKLVRPFPHPSWLLRHIICCYRFVGRHQSPRRLRRGSPTTRLLGLRVRIPPGSWMSVSCVVCCQVEVHALGRSPSRGVLMSVVCLIVISKPQQWGGLGSLALSRHEKQLSVLWWGQNHGKVGHYVSKLGCGTETPDTSPKIQDIGKFLSKEKGGYIFKQNFWKKNHTHNYEVAIMFPWCQYYQTLW